MSFFNGLDESSMGNIELSLKDICTQAAQNVGTGVYFTEATHKDLVDSHIQIHASEPNRCMNDFWNEVDRLKKFKV